MVEVLTLPFVAEGAAGEAEVAAVCCGLGGRTVCCPGASMRTAPGVSGHQPVLQGGPVQTDRGFVVHHAGGHWEHTRQVSSRIQVTTSPDILNAMARGSGPDTALVALGYAGWSAGQLESELAQNAWLTAPCDERILFDTPYEQRWRAAGRLLGVDLATISPHVGHA